MKHVLSLLLLSAALVTPAFAADIDNPQTDASKLSTGTLPAARLPNPSASTLGGVQSSTCSASQWLNTISVSGVPACAQPTFSNLATGTAPAFTLGGTISGGGNQINNVIIGTTTPLAGLFTTLSASTSLTSPLHIGGSGTTGTQLTLQTTTGVGTTDAIAVKGGNNGGTTFGTWNATGLALGSVAPDAPLTVSGNAAATVAPGTGIRVHLVGADTTLNRLELDSFGAANVLDGRRADGTAASKTATGASANTFAIAGQSWDGSAYSTIAEMDFVTVNAQSGSDHGSLIRFSTTTTGLTSIQFAAFINSKGGISIGPSAVDVGPSTLYLTPQAFASLPAAAAGNKGAMASVTDSTTIVWGATITGGGANPVMAWSNGTAWTVFGK